MKDLLGEIVDREAEQVEDVGEDDEETDKQEDDTLDNLRQCCPVGQEILSICLQ